ncbi:hypothetical protein TI04_04460 [Achromatium sp. WMS2]|nr:hypothetical protein TI04_04460 [Achromatium sp. WMS2]
MENAIAKKWIWWIVSTGTIGLFSILHHTADLAQVLDFVGCKPLDQQSTCTQPINSIFHSLQEWVSSEDRPKIPEQGPRVCEVDSNGGIPIKDTLRTLSQTCSLQLPVK